MTDTVVELRQSVAVTKQSAPKTPSPIFNHIKPNNDQKKFVQRTYSQPFINDLTKVLLSGALQKAIEKVLTNFSDGQFLAKSSGKAQRCHAPAVVTPTFSLTKSNPA